MAAMGKEQSWLSLWHLEECGQRDPVSPPRVSTMSLNQAHIPLQTAVVRSAGYADHDSFTAAARSDTVFFATISLSVCRLAKNARSLQFKCGD